MRVERILGTFGRGSELADLRPVSRAFQRRFGWEVACWPASRQPVCLQIVLLPNGGSIQTIWYYMVSGSVLLVLSLELQSFNFQRAQVKPSVLNNEVSTVATSCAFPAAFFDLLIFFMVQFRCCSFFYSGPLVNQLASSACFLFASKEPSCND